MDPILANLKPPCR